MLLRARQFEFAFPRPALLMGVVNATPDSFYDGGRHSNTEAAVAHALQLAAEGADIIDVGGESSRPRANPVTQAEELRRVIPVLEALAGAVSIPLSIDTVKPEVAREALRAGASIINDIAANRDDGEMWRLAARSGAAYVVVHMQGAPATMQENPAYDDVVSEVSRFFEERLNRLRACGVNPEQVVLDVGIGFGKALGHNLQLLARMSRFTKWSVLYCWVLPANLLWAMWWGQSSKNASRRRWPARVGASKMGRGLFGVTTLRPPGTPCA